MGYWMITHLDVGIGDEDVHRFQITWFIQGRYDIFEHVTMLPLYHMVVASLAKLTGLTSLDGLRLVHLVFAAGAIPAFYLLCRATYPAEAASRTLQFLWLPLLFPLFFVTYTDLPALAFSLLMLERTLRRSYFWAGLFGLVAVAMRQPNIAWVAYALCLVSLQSLRGGWGDALSKDSLLEVAAKARYLLLVMLVFLVFVFYNGGVAVGDSQQHPLSFNLSNLYFCLLVAWLLFLPFNIQQLGSIRHLLVAHRWTWALLALAFLAYCFTYTATHKYNSPQLDFYRHNLWIHYTVDFTVGRVLAFIPMAWMALSFVTAANASGHRREMLLLAPFAALSFLPMPLIEPRYYIVALCLFLALRPPMSRVTTVVTFAYYITTSAWILYNISRQNFFL
jgi:hypothetical protein